MFGTVNVNFGLSFSWKIPNFSGLKGLSVYSPEIPFNSKDGSVHNFCLECCPKDKEGFVGIYIHCTVPDEVSFNISILDKNGQKHVTFSEPKHLFESGGWGCFQLMKREQLLKKPDLLPDGVLSIECIITSLGVMIMPTDQRLPELSMDLKKLCLNKDHHDVSIIAGDKVYPAHKNILSARSIVFKAMLSHEMLESKENKIVISDIKKNVVRELLEYIYTGEAPNLNEMPEDLLVAADKYNLIALKDMCASCLSKNITADNACKRYLLSSLYYLNDLAGDIEKFFSANIKPIIQNPAFDEIMASNPDVLKKLLLSLSEN